MIEEATQSSCPFISNPLIKEFCSTTIDKNKYSNPFANQSNSFHNQFDFKRSTAYNPIRKNYVLTNRNISNKNNKFPTSHIGISRLNHAFAKIRQIAPYRMKRNKKKFNQEVESIVEKLIEINNDPLDSQVIETEADAFNDPIEEERNKEEKKREKVINDIHPKEYIKEAFSTEPNNSNAFRSYKLQLSSLGNEYNRRHVLNGVNGYNFNSIKYKTLYNPTNIKDSNDNRNLSNVIKEEWHLGKESEKNLFFGNNNLRSQKKVKLEYVERIVLPEIAYVESMDEQINDAVKFAFNTADILKKRSVLFRKKQKEFLAEYRRNNDLIGNKS